MSEKFRPGYINGECWKKFSSFGKGIEEVMAICQDFGKLFPKDKRGILWTETMLEDWICTARSDKKPTDSYTYDENATTVIVGNKQVLSFEKFSVGGRICTENGFKIHWEFKEGVYLFKVLDPRWRTYGLDIKNCLLLRTAVPLGWTETVDESSK